MTNNAYDYNVTDDTSEEILEIRKIKRQPKKRSLKKHLYNKFVRWYNKHNAIIIFIGLPLITAIITTIIATNIANYKNANKMRDYGRNKYYTTYMVQPDDTLWDIAADMTALNPEYPNIERYMDEIIEINRIYDPDNITSGNYLLLPYFSSGSSNQEIIETYDIK